MKLACSSASYDAELSAGALTQLEWLDACSRTMSLDGVAFDARHFPRTDLDYLAQCKKLAADLGLTVAGLICDGLLSEPEGDAAALWLEAAVALGAPIVVAAAPPAREADPAAWSGLAAAAGVAAAAAKRHNVVLAVRNSPGTLCATAADLKRLQKDVDSSWLRFALDAAALEPPETPGPLAGKSVIALHAARSEDAGALGYVIESLGGFRGFLVLDCIGASDGAAVLQRLVSDARTILAEYALGHRLP